MQTHLCFSTRNMNFSLEDLVQVSEHQIAVSGCMIINYQLRMLVWLHVVTIKEKGKCFHVDDTESPSLTICTEQSSGSCCKQ